MTSGPPASPPADDPRTIELELERLRDCLRVSVDRSWELDAELRYVWLSDDYAGATGEDDVPRMGQQIEDLPLVDGAGVLLGDDATLRREFAAGQAFGGALALRRSARGERIMSCSAMPLRNGPGRPLGWRGAMRDVTDAVQSARAALEGGALLNTLARQLPGVLHQFTMDEQGRVSFPYISAGLQKLFGLQPQDARNRSARVFDLIHPDDRKAMTTSVLQSQHTLAPWHAEYRVCPAPAEERWVETRAVPERLANGHTLWHGYSADITERKAPQLALAATEVRWQQAADAAGIGVLHFDGARGDVLLDARASVLHGRGASAQRIALADWAAQVADDDRPGLLDAVHAAAAGGERVEARYRCRLDGGGWRWLELTARARADGSGRASEMLGICRDVTIQHESEQLKRDMAAAERAANAQSQLLSRLSHELRTPLNGIQGFAQLMALDQDEPLGPTQQRRLLNVRRAGKHLLKLVDGVLELTRLERGDVQLQRRSVDLVRSLGHSLDLVRPLALNVGVVLPPLLEAAPATVWADTRALEQAFVNLLANAIHNNRSHGKVGVEIERKAGRVAVTISDEGPGLTPAQQALLFEPLQAPDGKGGGLDLAIACRLVLAMDGTLGVISSAPGQGSRLRLELPASDEAAVEDSGPASLLSPLSTPARLDGDGTPPRSVLYIEDEPLNVLLMEEVFRGKPQWRLEVARNGRRGLERARKAQPDLLLVDMNLPDMSGLDVVAALRAEAATARLLCIALSADALPEQIAAAHAGGFDDYWTKPIDVARLLAALDKAIERRAAGA